MSIRVMSAVWELDLPDSEKIVLLALADCANDDGACWPGMNALTRKCSKSDRTIQAAIKSLADKGHLTRVEKAGKGCLYTIHPRSGFAPEAASPPKRLRPEAVAGTPEAASGKPSKNHHTPSEATPPSGKRATRPAAHRIPADWQPEPLKAGSVAANIVATWEPGRLERELAKFRDYWAAASGQRARKHDWQAAWRTWISTSDERTPTNVRHARQPDLRHDTRGSRPDPALDMLRAARTAQAAGGAADGGRDRREAGAPLPALWRG